MSDSEFNTVFCELPDGYYPSEDEEFMCDRQREFFRRLLVAWKNDLMSGQMDVVKSLKEDFKTGPDLVDRASSEIDLAYELRSKDRARKLIAKIDGALHRLYEGTYGYCQETGEKIDIERLIARPVATLSLKAQEAHEKMEKIMGKRY